MKPSLYAGGPNHFYRPLYFIAKQNINKINKEKETDVYSLR